METSEAYQQNRLQMNLNELRIELGTVSAQNTRLSEENAALRHQINQLGTNCKVSSTLNVEAKLQLFKVESERDDLNAALQEVKVKYAKLQDAYQAKSKRLKILEDEHRKSQVLHRAVSKYGTSTPQNPYNSQKIHPAKPPTDESVQTLKENLRSAYDRIEELEFELESIDVLESENDRMRRALRKCKDGSKPSADHAAMSSDKTGFDQLDEMTKVASSEKLVLRHSRQDVQVRQEAEESASFRRRSFREKLEQLYIRKNSDGS